MEPKQKAISLVKEMSMSDSIQLNRNQYAIECAIIAVDEMILIVISYENSLPASQQSNFVEYWYAVKEEIKKLKNYKNGTIQQPS